MQIEVAHELPASPEDVLVWVCELDRYPRWTKLLHRVDAEPVPQGSPRSWQVELRGKIGPFARSKRLRMVEVPQASAHRLRFERQERDGVEHGVWKLDVRVDPVDGGKGTKLVAVFEYEGRLWSGAVERILRDEIESSKERLTALVAQGHQPSDHAL